MRRWLLIILLLVLPLQAVWAAGAPYCAHETTPAGSGHFGHHEHVHVAGDRTAPATGADDLDDGSGAYHADCELCHLSASATLHSPSGLVPAAPNGPVRASHPLDYRSHVPSGLERPDRFESVAATRFAGAAASDPIPTA